MRTWIKAVIAVALIPVVVVAIYIAYLTATYIDETVTSGSAYGFVIGSSMDQAIIAILQHQKDHPTISTYVSFGSRAGDNFSLSASELSIAKLEPHDQWNVLLDGPVKFFNSVRLTFQDGHLVEIHRHRQNFELP